MRRSLTFSYRLNMIIKSILITLSQPSNPNWAVSSCN